MSRTAPAPRPVLPRPSAGHEPGRLHLVVQGNRFLDNPRGPEVRLNGYPVAVSYGDNVVELPAGPVEVDVHCQWLRRYGEAHTTVDLPEDGEVQLFYAPPMHEFADGALGTEPQKRPGGYGALVAALFAAYFLFFGLNLLVR